MDGLDSTILKLFSNDTQLSTLHQKDLKGLGRKRERGGQELGGLSEEESLPELFGESFERLADEVKKVWKLNEEVEGMVQEAEERLGLRNRGEEDETKEVGDLVVGVHVRWVLFPFLIYTRASTDRREVTFAQPRRQISRSRSNRTSSFTPLE